MQVKSRKIYTQLLSGLSKYLFFMARTISRKVSKFKYFGGWGHSKSTFARNFQLQTPLPLFCPCLLYMYPVPPSTYVYFRKLSPPHTHIHPPNKIFATFMDFRMKNRRVKRQKRIFFFVNSTEKTNIFYTVVCTIAIKLFTKNYKKFIKKRFMKKNCLRLFNKKAPLFAGQGSKQQNFQQLSSNVSERTLFAV